MIRLRMTVVSHRSSFRSTVTIQEDEGMEPVVGTGDHVNRKDAEQLAALSALLQLESADRVSTDYIRS